MHGYVTAKNWGSKSSTVRLDSPSMRTPPVWDSNSPWTLYLNSPPSPVQQGGAHGFGSANAPTQLCRWAIHVPDIPYSSSTADQVHESPTLVSFQDSLQEAIVSGDFTEVQADNLPLSHDKIVRSLNDNPVALKVDSWKLAIMSGNCELLETLTEQEGYTPPQEVSSIFPFHLAASFISGGGSCCSIFKELSIVMGEPYRPGDNIDDLGHTILDTLMVSILRSHTRIQPDAVSYGFHSLSRFAGEEKDICGRWDVDSPEVRQLFAQGYARIPNRWKHPFCHSSVQAICHAIIILFGSKLSPNVNTLSGLFLRRCTECGMELKLGPLHTLVVTAFYLAQSGMSGETLFGPLALLVCLINMGANVSLEVNISVEEILRASETGRCRHSPMTPADLMHAVPDTVIKSWSQECQAGWACLWQTLHRAQVDLDRDDGLGSNHDDDSEEFDQTLDCILNDEGYGAHDGLTKLTCTGPKIGLLWATIQTEFLTYRRLEDNDPWISGNFSMTALQEWLESKTDKFETPLVQNEMMKLHSTCGWFINRGICLWALAEDACKKRFMNMDDYRRSSFSYVPDLLQVWYEMEDPAEEAAEEAYVYL
jgi:hypothetical protein